MTRFESNYFGPPTRQSSGQGSAGQSLRRGEEPAADHGRANAGRNIGQAERWLSAGAGAVLTAHGFSRGGLSGLFLALTGGGLVYRGVSGRCQCYAALGINTAKHNDATAVPAQEGYKIEKSITIHRSAEDLFGYWREVENLPMVMRHLKRVEPYDRMKSHWVAEGALGRDVEWDAEVFNERENEMIAWRSLPGGDLETAGSVHFNRQPGQQATEIVVSLKYNPPAGKLGAQVASLFGCGLEQKIEEDLERFKNVMEAEQSSGSGDQPHSSSQPTR